MQPSGSEREKNFDLGFLRKKSIHVVVKFCAYKSLGLLGSQKVLFQSCQRPVSMKWGEENECMHPSRSWNRRIFDLGCVRKKFSCGCQILRPKSRYADSRKVIFNLVNNLFKWNEGKSRSVSNLVALKEKKTLMWVFYEKKVFMSLSNFVVIKVSVC